MTNKCILYEHNLLNTCLMFTNRNYVLPDQDKCLATLPTHLTTFNIIILLIKHICDSALFCGQVRSQEEIIIEGIFLSLILIGMKKIEVWGLKLRIIEPELDQWTSLQSRTISRNITQFLQDFRHYRIKCVGITCNDK